MKIGDVLFLVPKNFPISDAFLAPVWYSGATRFSAGEYTFERAAEGDPFVGSHWRFGKAYESEGAFAETLGKRVAWRELRYTVARLEDAPANLSAAQIIEFINLLKGKQ
jgi:hypothetical protein